VTKPKSKRIHARVGDVFLVPVSDEQDVYGQVIDQAGPQFLVVLFRSSAGSVEDIVGGGIQLAGIVFDAKWRNGDWPIVTNRPPVKVRSPWFVVGHEGLGNLRLENFDGSVTHVATPTEAAKHRYRTISSPMALQWAAEAKHGRREWNKDLDCFRDLAVELSSG